VPPTDELGSWALEAIRPDSFLAIEEFGPDSDARLEIVPPDIFTAFIFNSSDNPSGSEQPLHNSIEPLDNDGNLLANQSETRSANLMDLAIIEPGPQSNNIGLKPKRTRRFPLCSPKGCLIVRAPATGKQPKGQNKFGRGGVPRCAHCRKHRQKVHSSFRSI
jgi:hypothetical protein